MKTDFVIALTQLAAERNLSKEVILKTLETALVPIFRKTSFAPDQDVFVRIAPQTGDVKVYARMEVVKRTTDPRQELSLARARKMKADARLGDMIEVEYTPANAGRIAAQTAKQVMLQRLREAERDAIFGEYADKEGDIVSGVVHLTDPKQIIVDIGRAEAILPLAEQVSTEHYRVGQRLKLYLVRVVRGNRGTQLVVSRTHQNLLRRLFELEVPEIYTGTVEIKALAREPGYRSKVAVAARQEGVDAVGCCLGLRSIRIQNIIKELNGEKIDIIQWHPDPAVFIASALSPAPVVKVEVGEEERSANVIVPDRQLSLAIGKGGQNARLAARLTGWRIDIKSVSMVGVEKPAERLEEVVEEAGIEERVEELAPSEIVSAAEAVAEAAVQPVAEEITAAPVGEVSDVIPALAETPSEVEVEEPVRTYSVEEILSQIEAATGRAQSRYPERMPMPRSEPTVKRGKKGSAPDDELLVEKAKPKRAVRRQRVLDEESDLDEKSEEEILSQIEAAEKSDEEILSQIEAAAETPQSGYPEVAPMPKSEPKVKKGKKGSAPEDELLVEKAKPKKAVRRQRASEEEILSQVEAAAETPQSGHPEPVPMPKSEPKVKKGKKGSAPDDELATKKTRPKKVT